MWTSVDYEYEIQSSEIIGVRLYHNHMGLGAIIVTSDSKIPIFINPT